MRPLVSILIPAYQSARWIGQTLLSAVSQTWPNKEIIVVDDGSKDATLAIAKQFQSADVKVVTQENQGASSARNRAFSLCQGDFIQWLDADDVLAKDKIERQLAFALQDMDPRILYSGEWGDFLKQTDSARFTKTALWDDLTPLEFMRNKLGRNLHMQPDCWLVTRQLTEAAGPWDTNLWRDNDGEYFCRVILSSSRIRFVRGAKSFYRRSGPSSISYIGRSERKLESLHRSMRLHVAYIRSLDDSEDTCAACLYYLRTWLPYFFPERMDLVNDLRELALELGGRLSDPVLPLKYRIIQKTVGWRAAKAAQRTFPVWKEHIQRALDARL